ncbi:MAG: holo-ACP synthase [Christensenellales bacterium]
MIRTGIDIIETKRFNIKHLDDFLEKYYSDEEIEYINQKDKNLQTIAGIYACKEAVLKAFKIGIGNGISLKDVVISHEKGNPYLKLNDVIKSLMAKDNLKEIDINISHSENNAIAICIII